MKRTLLLSLMLAAAPFALAQSGGMKGMEMKDMDMKAGKKAQGQVHKAIGKVTKVERGRESVTIAHEPVTSMNWPSMTMAFKVKDKAMLDKLKPGAKVDFSFTQAGRDYVITELK